MEAEIDIKKSSTEAVLMKVKEAYNYVNWNKGVPAHNQSKGCHIDWVKGLIVPSMKFVDAVHHSNGDLTLITNNNFFIRFSNR